MNARRSYAGWWVGWVAGAALAAGCDGVPRTAEPALVGRWARDATFAACGTACNGSPADCAACILAGDSQGALADQPHPPVATPTGGQPAPVLPAPNGKLPPRLPPSIPMPTPKATTTLVAPRGVLPPPS